MSTVLAKHPNTYFVLVGRESSTEALQGQLMDNLFDLAAAAEVEDHLLWLDGFADKDRLTALMGCSAAYVAVFDESTPTSVSLGMLSNVSKASPQRRSDV